VTNITTAIASSNNRNFDYKHIDYSPCYILAVTYNDL